MSKLWGVGRGMVAGMITSFAVGVVITMLAVMFFTTLMRDMAERNNDGWEVTFWFGLLMSSYFLGGLAVIWASMGEPYDYGYAVGLKDCKENKEGKGDSTESANSAEGQE